MVNLVEAVELELIKIRPNFQNAIQSSGSKPCSKPWVEVLEAFIDVTKLVETFCLVESVP